MTLDPAATGDIEAELQSSFPTPGDSQQAQYASLAIAAAHAAGRRTPAPRDRTLPRLRVFRRLGIAVGVVDADGAAALNADRRVQATAMAPELSLIRPVNAAAAAAPDAIGWNIGRLRVPELWAAGCTGAGVVIGHLDTGVDGSHPALEGAVAAFAEFDIAGNMVPRARPRDSGEHGTHTAATIVGRPGPRGAIGVAPHARIASALVIEGGQVIDRVLGGLEWALSRNVRVISMSLGLRGYTPAFQTVVDALRRANVLPIFAIGNEGPNTSRSPGNYDNVLSVGAMARDETAPDFSGSAWFNRPLKPLVPDLVAPGMDILSAKPGGGYQIMSGTSMATPHIAGLAALLLQARPGATAEELERAIVASCNLPATMNEARANHGVPDAVAAFTELTGVSPGAEPADAIAQAGGTAPRTGPSLPEMVQQFMDGFRRGYRSSRATNAKSRISLSPASQAAPGRIHATTATSPKTSPAKPVARKTGKAKPSAGKPAARTTKARKPVVHRPR